MKKCDMPVADGKVNYYGKGTHPVECMVSDYNCIMEKGHTPWNVWSVITIENNSFY